MRTAEARGHHAPTTRRGITQVVVVGMSGVVCVMGLGLAAASRPAVRSARAAADIVRAEFVANAGIEDAIARLRELAREGTEYSFDEHGDPSPWYTWEGTAGGGERLSFPANERTNRLDDDGDGLVDGDDADELATEELEYADWVGSTYVPGGDRYSLRVVDAASKINVNAGDNLGTILDNLCRVVGSPLVAADPLALVPKWLTSQAEYASYQSGPGDLDVGETSDLFYRLGSGGRPVLGANAIAVYGDGYAIAGYRARHGPFQSVDDVRNALTWIERGDGDSDGDGGGWEVDMPAELAEIEQKMAALRPHITIDSWCDTDQIGYGKFEHVVCEGSIATRLVDRNRTWNAHANGGDGELAGCLVSVLDGVGRGQLKQIARNTIDTIFLDDDAYPGSEMRLPPNHNSSYIIYQSGRTQGVPPLSIHRAPVNVNTAADKVLVALIMGLQTNWGGAGYSTRADISSSELLIATAASMCPSILSIGRDANNAALAFPFTCPNDSNLAYSNFGDTQSAHGHPAGGAPYCFFCSHGHSMADGASPGSVNEAHYLAWQILKEREQTEAQDAALNDATYAYSNGCGPFKGWDDLYFRVFRPWERAFQNQLAVDTVSVVVGAEGHPGVARLLMANFNSNSDILKFQPNLEWLNRWGPNFTELYLPKPPSVGALQPEVDLHFRPGELLDKSDLNIGTTEFSFDSSGIYEVESTGSVLNADGLVAERRFRALVKIYDVWRESTQREFVAGSTMAAAGSVGTSRSGQITAHEVSMDTPGGGSSSIRKSLCTYPEPIVPGDTLDPDGLRAPLAVPYAAAASYDGQILLATNMLATSVSDVPLDDAVSFYDSFTGRLNADVALGDGQAIASAMPMGGPVDQVGLLGEANGLELDLQPVFSGDMSVGGEGRGGDLRPDGVYLGRPLAGIGFPRDGSFEFAGAGNIDFSKGTVSMWVKPNWCHGVYRAATLPVDYLVSAYETGSTVPIEKWGSHWPAPYQYYSSESQRGAVGYVRERFEHEFFNAALPPLLGGAWSYAQAFNFRKAGDIRNTAGDSDMPEGGPYGSSPFGSLHLFLENAGDQDVTGWIPGWTVGDTDPASSEALGRPYYRMSPFRWHFVGFGWNYQVSGRPDFSAWGHCPFGQLREKTGSSDLSIAQGGTYDDLPRAEATLDKHLSAILSAQPFVDSMRFFGSSLDRYDGDTEDERLQDWSHEHYGASYQWGAFPFGMRPPFTNFGVNRAYPEDGHLYQKAISGTYATIDEFTISKTYRDARVQSDAGHFWFSSRRSSLGRYYLERSNLQRPYLQSQPMFQSLQTRGIVPTPSFGSEEIELGCVRWYAFTPHYCLDIPGMPAYGFPSDTYFLETSSADGAVSGVTQLTRYGPAEWAGELNGRNSSQRGVTVSIISGAGGTANSSYEYTDPEAWAPIRSLLGPSGPQNAIATPDGLRYRVRFGWSDEERRDMVASGTVAVDSPVFDDIAITYMRAPAVLRMEDISGEQPVRLNRPPLVDAGPDASVYVSIFAGLDGAVTDDGLPVSGTLTHAWSLMSGPANVVFDDAREVDTYARFTEPGIYILRLEADDGELTGEDEVTITVLPSQPGVIVMQPNGGEVWYVGTTHTIRYDSSEVPELTVSYSTDAGTTWNTIEPSVAEFSATWRACEWTVPDDSSTTCLVEVRGTLDEAADVSNGLFEIREFVDIDGDGMPDDWERDHGLDDAVNDGSLDSDGDGISNLDEFVAGTEPDDASSPGPPDDTDADDDDDGCATARGATHAAGAVSLLLGFALVCAAASVRRRSAAQTAR